MSTRPWCFTFEVCFKVRYSISPMAIDLRKEWIGLGLEEVDLSRLDATEQQRVASILERRSQSTLEDIRSIIAAAEQRRRETPSEEVTNGFGVIMSHGIDPNVMATVIFYHVKGIPGLVVTRVNRNEIFYSAPADQLEQLRVKLAEFENARSVQIGEGTLIRTKAA